MCIVVFIIYISFNTCNLCSPNLYLRRVLLLFNFSVVLFNILHNANTHALWKKHASKKIENYGVKPIIVNQPKM